jgi:hypothetical protein
MFLIITCSLLANNLVMSLIGQFNREIGMKSTAETEFSFFGTSVTYDPLMLCKQISPLKKASSKT